MHSFKTALALLLSLLLATPAQAARGVTLTWELQSAANGVEWANAGYSGAVPTISTTTFRGGAAALEVASLSSGTREAIVTQFPGAAVLANGTHWYLSAFFRYATAPSADNQIMGFCAVHTLVSCSSPRLLLTSAGALKLVEDTGGGLTTVGTSSALSANTWYCIGLRMKRDAATPNAGADEAELQIDGAGVGVSSTTLSLASAPDNAFVGGNANGEAQTQGNWFFDDIAFNDSNTGGSETGFPSCTRKTAMLRPNGAGEFAQTITIVGGEATVWESLDETTPDDGDLTTPAFGTSAQLTDNCASWACAAAGSRFMVAFGNMAETPTSVNVVHLGMRFTNDSVSGSNVTFSVQTADGGTKNDVATGPLGVDNTWVTNRFSINDGSYLYTMYTDPDAAAWTVTTLNSLQGGARTTDANPDVWVTSAWVVVDYEPPAGGAVRCCGGPLPGVIF